MAKMKKTRLNKTQAREGMIADLSIFYCTQCSRCWEKTSMYCFAYRDPITNKAINKKVAGYLFHENFPTYKRPRVKCGECSGETLVMKEKQGLEFHEIINNVKT